MTLNKINKNMIDPNFVQEVESTSNKIGNLSELKTTNKTDIVKSVNEVSSQLADKASKVEVTNAVTPKADRAYTDTQLSTKASTFYVDQQVASIGNASPKGTYATLTALQTAFPTGTTGVFVVTEDGNWYYWKNSTTQWTAGGIYQGVGLTDGSATFSKRTRLGELADIMLGATTSPPNLDLTAKTLTFDNTFWVINGKSRYTITGGVVLDYNSLSTATGLAVYFNISNQSFIVQNQTAITSIPENYLLVATISFNTARTGLVGFNIRCRYRVNGQDSALYFMRVDPTFTTVNSNVDFANIALHPSTPIPNYDSKTRTLTFSSTFYILYGKTRYTVTNGTTLNLSTVSSSIIAVHYNTVDGTFSINDSRFLSALPHTSVLFALLYTGDLPKAEFRNLKIDCKYTVDGLVPGAPLVIEDKPFRFAPEPIVGEYFPISVKACDGTIPGGFNEETDMSQDIYNKFDELMDLYPNYITKSLLGYDTTGELPIYRYDFIPSVPSPGVGKDVKSNPKIILGCSIHGNGPFGDHHTQLYSLYYFLEDICKHWKTNSLLEYLRWNINFVVVPIQNPWGINNRSRYNVNNVDINRNFDYAWGLDSSANLGSAPFSEVETRIMRDLILSNKDAVFYLDFHSVGDSGAIPDNILMWASLNTNSDFYYIAKNHIGKVSRNWQGKYGLSDLDFYGRITETALAPIGKNWVQFVVGMPAAVLEGFSRSATQSRNNENVMIMNTENLGNFVVTSLKWYKEKYSI